MADLFTAADLSTLSASIVTLLTVGVGIVLVYAGYRHVKRGVNKI